MFGVISENDDKGYTNLKEVFQAINHSQLNYNWLISQPELNVDSSLADDFTWMDGDELTKFAQKYDNIQWIWAILSGFSKDVLKEDVLQYKLGVVDEFNGYYNAPISFYHPLATIEIAPCDSSWLVLLSKEKNHIDSFKCHYISKDLFV